jgi:hypothetical protein
MQSAASRKASVEKYVASSKGKASRAKSNASLKGKAARKRYEVTQKGKAAKAKYNSKPERKEAQAKLNASPKAKATRVKYVASLNGREAMVRGHAKYNVSPKAKASNFEYAASARGKAIKAKVRAKRGLVLASCQENFTAEQLEILLAKWTGICPCCNQNRKLTIDHFYPLLGKNVAYRSNAISNIWLICHSCNASKSNREPLEFLRNCKAAEVSRKSVADTIKMLNTRV